MPRIFMFCLCLTLGCLQAQGERFGLGPYPLSKVSSSAQDRQAEYKHCLGAMLGGISLVEDDDTPASSKGDPEVLTRQDYRQGLERLCAHAQTVADDKQKSEIDKICKLVKGGKWEAAEEAIEDAGIKRNQDIESHYFVWIDYLDDLAADAPWLDPEYKNSSRKYRGLLAHVIKSYERPYGPKAEMGAILADAAQALSNALGSKNGTTWRGDLDQTMPAEDQLRRLAGVVAYFEWRLYEPANGRRSAHIDRKMLRLMRRALFDLVHGIVKHQDNWMDDSRHGENLQALYNAVNSQGWRVDGARAQKGEWKTPEANPKAQ